jgi:cell division protein FtsW
MQSWFKNIDARTNHSSVAVWLRKIDRVLLVIFISLMLLSAVLVTASSPPVAKRIGFEPFHFVDKQYIFLSLSMVLMIAISLLEKPTILRLAKIGLIGSLLVMCVLPIIGADAKGAKRWLNLGFLTLQPSEFMKPCFVIVVAWILAEKEKRKQFPAYKVSIALFVFTILLLLLQPDVGMVMTLTMIFAAMLFIAGIPMILVGILGAAGVATLFAAYMFFPHVQNRINGFLDPTSTDNYQVEKSLEAFNSGGIIGRGLGEGVVKWSLPDSHTDFIYAVIGEEFGLIFTLLAVVIYGFIVLRGLSQALNANELFIKLAVAGLTVQLGLQAFINMGVAVHLLPAKGMTLPFLSYGGSSLLAIAFTAGAILGLSKRQYGSIYSPTNLSNKYNVNKL